MSTRRKEVFPTKEIAHLWAHQTQTSARNPQGNLFFNGPVLYSCYRSSYPIASYRSSYPIARIVPNQRTKSGAKLVLIQADTYSSNTAGHIHQARQASAHMEQVTVPDLDPSTHKSNLEYFQRHITELEKSALASRISTELKFESLDHLIADANHYCQFFKLRKWFKSSIPEAKRATKLAMTQEALERARALHDAKRRVAYAERLPKAQERIDSWLAGSNVYLQYDDERVVGRGTLLRVKGDNVETSQGAVFPVSHARLGLRLVRKVMASGVPYQRNGHTVHLGHYPIDRINVDGTVHAGCHVVKYQEIERIAGQLESIENKPETEVCVTDIPASN